MLIILAFGAGGIWIFWAGYLHKFAWRGNEIRVSTPWRRVTYYRFSDIADVRENLDGSECKLHFANGRVVRVSIYFHGFHDFADELARRLPWVEPADPDR
jgi:hypothetical protein